MPELVYSERFVMDMTDVQSARVRNGIFDMVDLLKDFPDLGSSNLPRSIKEEFGGNVRRLAKDPFLVVYEYCQAEDEVRVLGLIHGRAVY